VLPFAISTSVLTLTQAATVAVPRARRLPVLERLRAGAWAAIPAASVVAVVFGLRAASGAAQGLTDLALFAVPVLAASALAWAARGGRPALAAAAIPLFALAWADHRGLAGEAAAVVLTALSCVTLGVLLASVAPARWLKWGIVVMALVDTALVVSDLLQAPNNVLNAASPGPGLPQLQKAAFGSAVMGYGDFFAAALLGALLASRWPLQRRAALVAAAIGLSFDLLFLVVNELPATVPIALTLLVVDRLAGARARDAAALGQTAPGQPTVAAQASGAERGWPLTLQRTRPLP
jgi:hypothetical protein